MYTVAIHHRRPGSNTIARKEHRSFSTAEDAYRFAREHMGRNGPFIDVYNGPKGTRPGGIDDLRHWAEEERLLNAGVSPDDLWLYV